MSRAPQVKNRSAAAIQITAEQLLRIANNQGIEKVEKAPTQYITDKEELAQYQQTKRKDFEDQIRRSRHHIGIWTKYALWEASQKEFERARSVFERALDVDYRSQTIWLKYADMEMKNKFVNHARNVWDRAVTLHPRVDSFWYKYSYMEEMAGAIDNARQVFERWMQWEPDDMSWAAFIKFEMRQGQIERARAIYEKYITLLPTCRAYLKYARWEEKLRQRGLARAVYERALSELHPQERTEKLLVSFARFEERCKEVDRARVIYQYALSQVEGDAAAAGQGDEEISELKKEFIAFEKRHGSKDNIENAIVKQRREHYNARISEDIYDYDTWFDFIRLEESEYLVSVAAVAAELEEESSSSTGNNNSSSSSSTNALLNSSLESVRSVYNRAVACVPPLQEKRFWRRYIYLWINYAVFEELIAKNVANTREVYRACLLVVPHKVFTFGKIWLMAAHFEVRQKDLAAARRLLGQAIGMSGGTKESIFKGYILLERQLGEIDRCRQIYGKYVTAMPHNSRAWLGFASLEASCGETQRARAIYELAIGGGGDGGGSEGGGGVEGVEGEEDAEEEEEQLLMTAVPLDMPETLWRAYIDWEISSEGQYLRARDLYTRLLRRSSGHVKVWVAYAQFLFESGAFVKQQLASRAAAGGARDEDGNDAAVDGADNDANSTTAAGAGAGADVEAARAVFLQGYEALKRAGLKEERLLILEAWRDVEHAALLLPNPSTAETAAVSGGASGDRSHLQAVERRFPRKVKMRRPVLAEDGETELGMEDYFDYIFPDDEDKKVVGMKLLEKAMAWKKNAAATAAAPAVAPSVAPPVAPAADLPGEGEIDIDDDDDNDDEEEGSNNASPSTLGKRKHDDDDEEEED